MISRALLTVSLLAAASPPAAVVRPMALRECSPVFRGDFMLRDLRLRAAARKLGDALAAMRAKLDRNELTGEAQAIVVERYEAYTRLARDTKQRFGAFTCFDPQLGETLSFSRHARTYRVLRAETGRVIGTHLLGPDL